jgi:hypothetical protein
MTLAFFMPKNKSMVKISLKGFIRSLATRGSLGGLHPKVIEITDVMKAAPFDYRNGRARGGKEFDRGLTTRLCTLTNCPCRFESYPDSK